MKQNFSEESSISMEETIRTISNNLNGSSLLESLKEELSNKNIIKSDKFDKNFLVDYDIIGFDVDHTLECYNMFNFPSLLYSCFAKYLIEHELYPVNLNIYDENIESENMKHEKLNFLTIINFQNFACKEVLLDLENGNALKIAEDLTILKAYHGVKEMSQKELSKIYLDGKFPKSKNFDYNIRFTENYFYVRGYIEFHISAIFLFCVELLDLKYLNSKKVKTYKDIFSDLNKALNFNYKLNEENSYCYNLSGYYYPEMNFRTSYYLDEEINKNEKLKVRKTLENLRKKGKKLFFATNSFYDYANMIMNISLGDDYKDLFDLCFYFAKKPIFFQPENENLFSFYGDSRKYSLPDLEDNEEIYKKAKLQKIILGGSGKIVESFFKKLLQEEFTNFDKNNNFNYELNEKMNKKILYIGDNFSTDCFIPSLNKNWNTVAIDECLKTGYLGKRNEALCKNWIMEEEDEIKEYRFKIIREACVMAITNVQLLDEFI